jgi:hypothetical protein
MTIRNWTYLVFVGLALILIAAKSVGGMPI